MSCTILMFPQTAPRRAVVSPEQMSGQVVQLEPYRVLRDFGGQWQAYLRAHFASITDAALAFGVTERAARRWWDGAGPRGAFVAIALRMHPATAPEYLLADQACAEGVRVAAAARLPRAPARASPIAA